jgi:hypothetical protein
MTTTPETDDLARGNHVVPTEFAQDLERQRNEARTQVKLLKVENNHNWQAMDIANEVTRERDQWRECAEVLAKQVQYWMDRESDWGPDDEAAMNKFNSLKEAAE